MTKADNPGSIDRREFIWLVATAAIETGWYDLAMIGITPAGMIGEPKVWRKTLPR